MDHLIYLAVYFALHMIGIGFSLSRHGEIINADRKHKYNVLTRIVFSGFTLWLLYMAGAFHALG